MLHLHEDFKMDLKGSKGNLNKWKDTMVWLGRLLIIKMSVFFTQIHKFNVTPIKILTGFLIDNLILKLYRKTNYNHSLENCEKEDP